MPAQRSSLATYATIGISLAVLVCAQLGINPIPDPSPELGAWAVVISMVITGITHYLTKKAPPPGAA